MKKRIQCFDKINKHAIIFFGNEVFSLKKAIIVYWSGTGNTEIIANKILEGLNNLKVKANIYNINDITLDEVLKYDNIILGSPAMGDEQLEEEVFEPFFEKFLEKAENKNISIFGSYGWGNMVWLDNWEKRIKDNNKNNFLGKLAVFSTPTTDEEEKCIKFGEELAKVKSI